LDFLNKTKKLNCLKGGDFQKDYMFVDDICRSIKFLIDKSNVNEIYNISTGYSKSFRDIILTARDVVSSKSEILSIPFPKDQEYIQVKNMTLDNHKLSSLGYFPNMNFDEGLLKMCKIY